jgi:hypothetical protein
MKLVTVIFLAIVGLAQFETNLAFGQIGLALRNPKVFEQPHEFKNSQGEVLANGVFKKLLNGRVYVLGLNGKEEEILMTDLSTEDQEFVRMTTDSNKKKANAEKVIRESLYLIDISRPVEIVKGCDKLKSLGKYGNPAAANVINLAAACKDGKAKNDLFLTYVEIAEISDGSIQSIFNTLTSPDFREVLARVERNPGPFFNAYAKMDEAGLEYLQFVAYRAKLLAPEIPPVAPTEPDVLEVNDKEAFARRAAAISAMANIPGQSTLTVVLKTLEVSEKPVLGEIDEETIKACLKALGDLGLMEEDVELALNRHAEKFPEIVTRAREKIAKAQSKK